MRITKDNPGKVYTKTSFSEVQDWTVCNVLKKGRRVEDIKDMSLEQLVCKNKISKEKLKNLQDMLDYIPLKNLAFYENLIERTQQGFNEEAAPISQN